MKRFVGIMIVLMLNTFTAAAQNAPENVMPLVFITEPADTQPGYPNFDLYVMNPQTGDISFKSTTPDRECPLAVSPDGKSILYQQEFEDEGQVKFAHYFVDLTTGEQREIDLGNNLLQRSTVMWPTSNGKFYFTVQNYGDNRIYEYDLITDTIREVIRSEPFIAMMQLGTEIVYWTADDTRLMVNDLNGNSYKLAYSELFTMGRPSPNGHYLVREVNKEQQRDKDGLIVYQYDYILSDLTQKDVITISDAQPDENLYQFGLVWRSDSQAVFYYDLDENFVVYDLAHRQKTLFPAPDFRDTQNLSGYWSPDGLYIAYIVDYGSVSHQDQNELGIVDTVSGEVDTIATYNDPDGQTGYIQWVDNHQFIYFSGNYGGNVVVERRRAVDIVKYDVTTKTRTNLTETPNLTERMDCWYG